MKSLGLCSVVDRVTKMAFLALKSIEHLTYKMICCFLCCIAKDTGLQLQIKYLNKNLKVLGWFLFILKGSTTQS